VTLVSNITSVADRPPQPQSAPPEPHLQKLAQEFEAVILAEFLRAAGSEGIVKEFGGGIGEDQFASLLTNAQAEHMAARGGLGIAEMVLRAMMTSSAGKDGVS